MALLVVSIILLFVIFLPKIIIRNQVEVDSDEVKYLDSLASLFENDAKFELFLFDPNKLPEDSLMLLGFPPGVAERLVNYRNKGGRFYTKHDVKKIYGISEQLVDSLYPYINLPAQISETNNYSKTQKFNINTASTDQLKKVSMIGDVLASRIVKYRELLGGFIAVNQLDEVYGLSDIALKNLKSTIFLNNGFRPVLIKINYADWERLKRHPYISDRLAEDIIRYREINSSIESEKVLVNFKSIDKRYFEKLILYLDFK